ncbi:MAG: diguanylate cyclase and metal dependent phosphohydrolase [Firmicutes bacterium]|nr:diguanylate cyclase and metal dependent phosphohydrolase [Bacillota bacterium]
MKDKEIPPFFALSAMIKAGKFTVIDPVEQEENDKLERFFAVTPDLLCIANMKGDFIKINKAWTVLLGYSVAELEKRKFLDFVHPDDQQATLDAMAQLANQEQVLSFVNRYRCKDGSYRYVEWRSQSYGNLIYGAAREVTDVVQRERDLKANLIIKEKHLELMKLNTITIPELLNKSLNHVIPLTGSKLGYIFLCDEEKQEILLHSWSEEVLRECEIKDRQRLYSLAHVKLWGEAVRRRGPVIVNDYMSSSIKKKGYPPGHVPIKKFLSIPVFDREQIVAIVGVANKETDYNEEDVMNLSLLMNTVWIQVERKKNEELLNRERALFRATLYSMNEGVIATDQVGKIILMNNAAEDLTGWSKEEVYGGDFSKIFNVIDANTRENVPDPVSYLLKTGQIRSTPVDGVLIAKNGCECYIESSTAQTVAENGVALGAVVSFRDITAEREKQKQIEYLSYHDQLTGLFNRRFLDMIIGREMERSDRYNEPLSMIVLDLDHFKKVNDTWGHPIGDEVLKQTAAIAGNIIRKSDILARLGGEEFVIVMPATTLGGAIILAEKLRETLDKNSHPLIGKYTASFGVAERVKFESFKHWYKRADGALYRAKARGRNQVDGFSDQEN